MPFLPHGHLSLKREEPSNKIKLLNANYLPSQCTFMHAMDMVATL